MGLRASPQGLKIVERARIRKNWTKASPQWLQAAYTSEATLRRFWRREPIKQQTFQDICKAVNVNWQEIVEQTKAIAPDSNFVGREEAINDLNQLTAQGAKLILIQGQGGIGKTTLARYYFDTQGFDLAIKLHIAMERENIISVELAIEEWLQCYFAEDPGREFGITLDRLRRKLESSKQKIGILIDRLGTALQRGRFVPQHRCYAELLRMLANPSLNSVTLITSREQLCESAVIVETYRLPGLSEAAWQEFFYTHQVEIDTGALNEMHYTYGGNAEAMCILANAIRLDFAGNLHAYWQENRHDLLLDPTLENLIEGQFDKLKGDYQQAYQLLCRLGCYRYQEIPILAKGALLCLLWDVPASRRERVIKALRDRALIGWDDGGYYLHPVMQAKAKERLKEEISNEKQQSKEWLLANRAAAQFYLELYEVEKVDSEKSLKYAFEAIEHLAVIRDFEECCNVLLFQVLAADKIENLRGTANLWNNMSRFISSSEKIINHLSGIKKALLFIPLGTIYSEVGKNSQALKISEQILAITSQKYESEEQVTFARMSAYSIAGKAYRYQGNLHKAEVACQQANKIASNSGKNYWQALAVYGLGAVYLEKNRPRKALRHFLAAAAYAKLGGITQELKRELKKLFRLLFNPKIEQIAEVQTFFQKYNQNELGDRIKKFNILWNIARCFNEMKSFEVAKRVLDLAQRLLKQEDNNQQCLLALELATYYSGKKQIQLAQEWYQKALDLSVNQGEKWSIAYPLQCYANWLYSQSQYSEALAKYRQLEELLQGTEFCSMQAYNYYYLGLTILQVNPEQQQQAHKYLKKARKIATEIGLVFSKSVENDAELFYVK
ncbi:tetratricopeptide repeat protein [Dapis sp. BLCC M229]|uniref:tetratricopeptide repeat protein n=1 Tax=Dapis sp. BLCC M229 TaxID=3400188 RepID=UPI003CFB751E